MSTVNYTSIIQSLKDGFNSGITRSIDFRKKQLNKLLKALDTYETELLNALHADLGKHKLEAYSSEIGILKYEIKHTLRNLDEWVKTKYVSTPLHLWPAKSYIQTEPLGVVLILSPWNYPVLLFLTPFMHALAAGNVALLKPSEHATQTTAVLARLIRETFPANIAQVIEGPGEMISKELIAKFHFDHIFFTGSIAGGKDVMRKAAEHLSPVTLELGGKSPVIVNKDVSIKIAAKRIAWTKFWNAGQTCVAPDYVLVHEQIQTKFIDALKLAIIELYGNNPQNSESYSRIINKNRFEKLTSFLSGTKIEFGGNSDKDSNYIEPTIITGISLESPIMKEEIFGPILPILPFKNEMEALNIIAHNPYPLSLYVYSKDDSFCSFFTDNIQFGGGGINTGLIQLANPELPFGGIGTSGTGKYHGKFGFDTFSHKKPMVKEPFWIDIPLRYPPFRKKFKWIKKLL